MYNLRKSLPTSSSYVLIGLRRVHDAPKRKPFDKRDQFGSIGYQAIQVNKLVSRHPFRNSHERIISDKWENYGFKSEVPVIQRSVLSKYNKGRLEKLDEAQDVELKAANVIIQCARKEFNHYEGMYYPQIEGELPLVSENWYKNKYIDDWFIIHRTQATHVTTEDSLDRTWEEFIHLIHPQIFRNIAAMGFKTPTKVQYDFFKAYPNAKHIFMAGETGSGKTLAYGATILSKLIYLKEKHPNAKVLVLTPSKQLKDQTVLKLQEMAENTDLKVITPFKGQTYGADDFDVLVSTPGFAYNILKKLGDSVSVQYLIMDETDMMLDDSFVTEIANILSVIPLKFSETSGGSAEGAQIIFSSATCPPELTDMVDEIIDGRHVYFSTSRHLHKVLPNIEQKFIRVREKDKIDRLISILMKDMNSNKNRVMIFCKDNKTAEFLSKELTRERHYLDLDSEKLKKITPHIFQ